MLKAAIIYIPGSGGSFLRRALSLAKDLIVETAYDSVDIEQKFSLFNNWNLINWKLGERQHRPAYRDNRQDFYQFEQSELLLIDAWHPTEFLQHDKQQICWPVGKWANLIFINVNESHREFIENNQQTKSYYVNWQNEIESLAILRDQYSNSIIDIQFDDLLDRQQFLIQTNKINFRLDLNLDMNLVAQLWESWYHASQKIWHK